MLESVARRTLEFLQQRTEQLVEEREALYSEVLSARWSALCLEVIYYLHQTKIDRYERNIRRILDAEFSSGSGDGGDSGGGVARMCRGILQTE